MSKISITVQQRVDNNKELFYIVIQTKNITTPNVGKKLTERDVQALIVRDIDVTIKPHYVRRRRET